MKQFFKNKYGIDTDGLIFWMGNPVKTVYWNTLNTQMVAPTVKIKMNGRKHTVILAQLKNHDKTNQIVLGAPKLAENQQWNLIGYLYGSRINKTDRKFNSFPSVQFIGRSKDVYHFIGDGDKVLVCGIVFKN